MAMQRPAWTICFFLCCALIVPGAILTHIALVESIPWLEDLPENIDKGLQDVFKFAEFKFDTSKVVEAAEIAVGICNLNATEVCPPKQYPPLYTQANTSSQRREIINRLNSSLVRVSRVAHDKYFGVTELQPTANDLDEITQEFQKTEDVMPCSAAVPVYCEIHTAANDIITGYDDVDAALNRFSSGEIIDDWEEYAPYLEVMHSMPYILVVGVMFFYCFWMRGGVCCCCEGGTLCGFVLIFYAIFWLLCFILYFVICVVGISVKYFADRYEVTVFDGNPTVDEVLDHIQTKFPEFWNVVFADMEDGLSTLLTASFFMVAASLLIVFYSCCECCCCPYRGAKDAA